jgi:hypothetical protein
MRLRLSDAATAAALAEYYRAQGVLRCAVRYARESRTAAPRPPAPKAPPRPPKRTTRSPCEPALAPGCRPARHLWPRLTGDAARRGSQRAGRDCRPSPPDRKISSHANQQRRGAHASSQQHHASRDSRVHRRHGERQAAPVAARPLSAAAEGATAMAQQPGAAARRGDARNDTVVEGDRRGVAALKKRGAVKSPGPAPGPFAFRAMR